MLPNEELWQAYTLQGEPVTSAGLTKDEARDGVLHGAAHLWIWRHKNDHIEVLLQQRAADKKTWPGFYDISAAGHIDFGETPIQAALREAKEEIGLSVSQDDLRLLFVHYEHLQDRVRGYIEQEFRWVYGLSLNHDTEFHLADGEVSSLLWLSLDEFQDLITSGRADMNLVPQGKDYFNKLLSEIVREV